MQKKFLTFSLILLFIGCFPTKVDASDNFDLLIENTENTTISILTCDPGNEIYSFFGHSALRIQNPKLSINWVINWGLFEFNEDQIQFGYDFAKGRLNYYVGIQEMPSFIYEYAYYKRGVREQILNLNTSHKKKIINLVQKNYQPENRTYKYDFFYDNCSTRIQVLLDEVFEDEIEWGINKDANKFTFREIIHKYLNKAPWLTLGIDLVLGKRIDVLVNNSHLMFLPDYIEKIADNTYINEKGNKEKLVSENKIIINSQTTNQPILNITIYAWILFGITIILLVTQQAKLINIWSCINLLSLAILGGILVFMWWGTDHQATKYNFNLLWASPLHLYLFSIIIKPKWNLLNFWFILISMTLLFLTILFWFTLTQEFNPFIKPLILQLIIIYYYYFRKCKFHINLLSTSN